MPTNIPNRRQKVIAHKIFVDAGGWYLAYYMGVFHYIFTTFGVDCFKDVHFEGVSAGGQCIGYVLATIHGCKDMKYWLDNGPKHAISNNNYGNGRLTLGCYNAGKHFYKTLDSSQKDEIKKKYCSLSLDSSFNPFFSRNISNTTDFACAVASTGNIPIVGSFHPWKHQNNYLWDGCLNFKYNHYKNLDYNTKKVLFFSLDKDNIVEQNIININLSKWTNFSPLKSISISFYDKETALLATDELFENGFSDAKLNHDEIYDKLCKFGIIMQTNLK